jgi:hypothetical protein
MLLSDAGAYGKREERAAGQVFGHREEREFAAYKKQRVQAFSPGGSEARRSARMPVARQVLLDVSSAYYGTLYMCPPHK